MKMPHEVNVEIPPWFQKYMEYRGYEVKNSKILYSNEDKSPGSLAKLAILAEDAEGDIRVMFVNVSITEAGAQNQKGLVNSMFEMLFLNEFIDKPKKEELL
jgi:hypothetical protein